MGIDAFIDRIHSAGLKAFFFIDMIVLPVKIIDHYKDEILNKDGYILFNDVTAKILSAMLTETLQRFPGIDGLVHTGETFIYDTPYHKGNSPTIGVKSYIDQQQIWIPFINFTNFMEFNQQLAIGKHAQVVEVECRRSFEGKGTFPDYSKAIKNE